MTPRQDDTDTPGKRVRQAYLKLRIENQILRDAATEALDSILLAQATYGISVLPKDRILGLIQLLRLDDFECPEAEDVLEKLREAKRQPKRPLDVCPSQPSTRTSTSPPPSSAGPAPHPPSPPPKAPGSS